MKTLPKDQAKALIARFHNQRRGGQRVTDLLNEIISISYSQGYVDGATAEEKACQENTNQKEHQGGG